MKTKILFFKNSIRKIRNNSISVIAVSFLLFLTFFILFSIFSVNLKVLWGYNEFKKISNVRDSVMEVDKSYRLIDPSKDEKDNLPENQELYQQYILNRLALENNFEWSKTEEWNINNIKNHDEILKLKVLSKTHSISNNCIDCLVIDKGRGFSNSYQKSKREVIINKQFAKENNIKIGEVIRLHPDEYGDSLLVKENQNVALDISNTTNIEDLLELNQYYGLNWYQVIGFGSSADFAYPIFGDMSFLPNMNKEAIVYLDYRNMGFSDYKFNVKYGDDKYEERNMKIYNSSNSLISLTSEYDGSSYFSIKFNNRDGNWDLDSINKKYKEYGNLSNNSTYFYNNNDKNSRSYSRVNGPNKVILLFNIFSSLLLTLIFSICLFIIYLVTKKDFESSLNEIGYLKSMGYKNKNIIINYLANTLFSILVGFIFSLIFFYSLEILVLNIFSGFFNFSFKNFNYLPLVFLTIFIFFILIFIFIIKIISFTVFNKGIIYLNNGVKTSKISYLARQYKKLYKSSKFNKKLRSALFLSSLTKITGIAAAMLLCSTLTTATIVIPKQVKRNYESVFSNIYYKNKVEYTSPLPNNPLSFYKTYNPNFKDEEWGFDFKNKIIDQYVGSKSKDKVSTAYPLLEDKKTINWNKVTENILNSDIHSEYYSYDIAQKNNTAWAEFSWLNWKNLSTSFLLDLDNAEIDSSGLIGSIGSKQTIKNIYSQWKDYDNFKQELVVLKNKNPGREQLLSYNNLLLNFYKKYIGGLPLKYNSKIIVNNQINIKEINKILKKETIYKGDYFSNYDKYWKISKDYNDFYEIKNSEVADFNFTYNDKLVDVKNLKPSSISDWENQDIIRLNNNLTLWFTSVFEWRLGMGILLLTYTNSPYFIQQKIIKSIELNENYNVSNSLVPYDKKIDELGTYFKANYKDQDFNIYGVNEKSKLNLLKNKKNRVINNQLFNDSNFYYPLIINKALSENLKIKEGNVIDINIYIEKLEKYINNKYSDIGINDLEMGWSKSPFKDFRTQSSRSYYSAPKSMSDYRNFSDTSLGIPVSFNSAKIGGVDFAITNGGAVGASNQPPIHKRVTDNELQITNNIYKSNKKFKIVGIEKSYGTPKAWITNDNANEIIGYDKVEEFNFNNFFIPEWAHVEEIYTFEQFSDEELKNKLKNISYKEFKANRNKNEKWKNMYDFFINQYPIFNYKLSSKAEIFDLTSGLSNSQRYGDYSQFGTRGSYGLIYPENCEKEEECEPIIDKNNYYEGFSIATLKGLLPVNSVTEITKDLIATLNFSIYIFIIILLIITFIILMLATTLIITDNKEFINGMKIMGYSNFYIINQIFNVYNGVILFMFSIGFLLGLLLLRGVINFASLSTSLVFFTTFIWWHPLLVFLLLSSLYILTFYISWFNVKKIRII